VRIFAIEQGFIKDGNSPSWFFGDNFIKRHPILLDGNKPPRIGFINLTNGQIKHKLELSFIIALILAKFKL
jgi:hypothetical protein